jgi:hypothetical protein
MDTKHLTAILPILALATACGGSQAVRLNESSDVRGTRWQGTVSTPPTLEGAVEIGGTAWMAEAEGSDSRTQVEVAIQNAAPGGVHPWHVRRGQCGSGWEVFGDSTAYEPLEVGNDGRATASAILDEPLPASGEHSVTILASPRNPDLIVGCANLAPPVAGGFR